MPTPILKIITEYCEPLIDDIRLTEKKAADAPSYAWTMWGYLNSKIGLFSTPPEMPEYLFGTPEKPRFAEPAFTSYRYATEAELTEPLTISLPSGYTGYELFAAQTVRVNSLGDAWYEPSPICTYDAENGTVTINAGENRTVPQGTVFDFDFYTDGRFEANLNREVMSILGLCFEVAWLKREKNNWLSNVPKTEDKAFKQQNAANHMAESRRTYRDAENELYSKMRKLEQNDWYKQTFPRGILKL